MQKQQIFDLRKKKNSKSADWLFFFSWNEVILLQTGGISDEAMLQSFTVHWLEVRIMLSALWSTWKCQLFVSFATEPCPLRWQIAYTGKYIFSHQVWKISGKQNYNNINKLYKTVFYSYCSSINFFNCFIDFVPLTVLPLNWNWGQHSFGSFGVSTLFAEEGHYIFCSTVFSAHWSRHQPLRWWVGGGRVVSSAHGLQEVGWCWLPWSQQANRYSLLNAVLWWLFCFILNRRGSSVCRRLYHISGELCSTACKERDVLCNFVLKWTMANMLKSYFSNVHAGSCI